MESAYPSSEVSCRYADVQALLMGSRSVASIDLTALREDQELMAVLASIQQERRIYLTVLDRLSAQLNDLTAALEAAGD